MQTGIENIIKHQVIELSFMGILIVFCALTLISLFLACLPKVLTIIEPFLPQATHGHQQTATSSSDLLSPNEDQQAIVAAIGFTLHHRQLNKHT